MNASIDLQNGKSFAIRRHFFVPMLVAIIFLPILLAAFAFYEERDHKRQSIHGPIKHLMADLWEQQTFRDEILLTHLAVLTQDSLLRTAFLARDREALLRIGQPILDELRHRQDITHFYIHDPDGVNFFRVHQPDHFGDSINRQSLQRAMLTGQPAFGMELGPLGTLTMRAVVPWKDQERLIGYLELGVEIRRIVKTLRNHVDVQLFTFINKQNIDQTLWRNQAQMLGVPVQPSWDQFSELLLMDNPDQALMVGLKEYVATGLWKVDDPLRTQWEGEEGSARNFQFFTVHIKNLLSESVGYLVAVQEHRGFDDALKASLIFFSLAVVLCALLVWYLLRLLTHVEQAVQREAAALQKSEESLAIAQSIAHLGSWDWNLKSNALTWSDEVFQIFGADPEAFEGTIHGFMRRVYPADRLRLKGAVAAALNNPSTPYMIEHRVLRDDGLVRVVQENGKVFRDAQGRAVRMVGTVHDVTDKRLDERTIFNSMQSRIAITALLESGLENLSLQQQMYVALEIILAVTWLNLEYKGSFFRYDDTSSELVSMAQRNLSSHLIQTCQRVPVGRCLCGRAAETRQLIFANHVDERHDIRYEGMTNHGHYCLPILAQDHLLGVLNLYVKAGSERSLEGDAFLTTVAYTLAGIIQHRVMEEKLRTAEVALQQLAYYDDVTGLPNRVLFHELLEQNLAQAERMKTLVALLFIDLDRFKEVNDTFGHGLGDRLLKEASERMKRNVRAGDMVSRLGGDEFIVLLPNLRTMEEAGTIAERIVYDIQQSFFLQGQPCSIGSSIGIALYPYHGTTAPVLIQKADIAMYTVKRNGKNHWRYYDSSMGEQVEGRPNGYYS